MATRPCPHCGERIQNAAAMCRFCRQQVPKLPDRNPLILYGGGGFLLLVGVAAGVAAVMQKSAPAQSVPAVAAAPAPNPQPETVPPPIAPGTADNPPAPPTALSDDQKFIVKALKGQLSADEMKKLIVDATANKSITYAHLKKNADRYKWKPWRCYGRIVEIAEENGSTRGRISLSDYSDSVLYFEYPGETDFVQNNVVEMAGLLASNFSYTSEAGWNITIPAISAVSITKRGGLDKIAGIKHRASSDEDE